MLDQIYLKLGQVEIDDMAEGVKALWNRPVFRQNARWHFRRLVRRLHRGDGDSALSRRLCRGLRIVARLLTGATTTRFIPNGICGSPEGNQEGYDEGSAMPYADKLQGRLLIYYGSADNNVHPANSMQLIKALQAAGKSFELQVGPDEGHSAVNQQRMMEFFIENLAMRGDSELTVLTVLTVLMVLTVRC